MATDYRLYRLYILLRDRYRHPASVNIVNFVQNVRIVCNVCNVLYLDSLLDLLMESWWEHLW